MGKPIKYSKESLLEAINGSGGIVSTIADRLGCQWCTARKYINQWEETKQAFDDETERVLDKAESVLHESINEGNTHDAKWYLSTKGKKRGFSEKHELEHSGPGGGPLEVSVNFVKASSD